MLLKSVSLTSLTSLTSLNTGTSVDKTRIGNCFAKALSSYDQQALAQQQINRRLCTMLQQSLSKCGQQLFDSAQVFDSVQVFDLVMEIGCGSGDLTRLLNRQYSVRSWWLNDLNSAALAKTKVLLQQKEMASVHLLAADAEQLDRTLALAQQFDLWVSASTVQWFQQPQRFIQLAAQGLKQHGILLFSTFLPDNLAEIKQLTNIGLTYPTQQQWLQWLQPHFELLALDSQPIRLYFEQPSAVLQHLKATGVTATHTHKSGKQLWTKGKLAEFYQRYRQQFSLGEQVYLTYSPLLILAKRK